MFLMTTLNPDRKLVHLFQMAGLGILQGSDQHIPLHQFDAFAKNLIVQTTQNKAQTDFLVLNGDHFDASEGEATQEAVGDLLREISNYFDKPIIYVPGNHCLRGRDADAWSRFGRMPNNVYAPLNEPTQPITLNTRIGNIVIANIFYDFDMVDPSPLGFSTDEVCAFYPKTRDGKTLLGGNTELFDEMARNLVAAVTPQTSIMITHCLISRQQLAFNAEERNEEIEALEKNLKIPFITDPAYHRRVADYYGTTIPEQIAYANKKTCMLGSEILSKCADTFSGGLHVITGHNHVPENRVQRFINGKEVVFCTFQNPYHWKDFHWVEPRPI